MNKYHTKEIRIRTYEKIPFCNKCNKKLRSLRQGITTSIETLYYHKCDICDDIIEVSGKDRGIFYKKEEIDE